jgi:prepilin-type N-terminal cleavage/methylation domain-containing protein
MLRTRNSIPTARRARVGFTLLELLAVIVILGLLVGILVTALGGAEDSAKARLTRVRLQQLAALIEAFERERGDFPPSTLPEEAGGANTLNVGAEALVATLWSRGYEAGGGAEADDLGNSDGDSSKKQFTDFPDRQLFEFLDSWGNPIAYFHQRDYTRPQVYLLIDQETGEVLEQEVTAAVNPRTKRPYRSSKFQLRSAGPNGRFDPPEDEGCDDVFDFDLRHE